MSDDRGRSTGSWAGWGFGGLIIIYFGFPALWIWPLWKVYGATPPRWLEPIGIPVSWLAQQFPMYQQWIQWGADLLGIK
jgi:hypothetical protein